MPEPLPDERLAEIRERAARITEYGGARAGEQLAGVDVPALLAEIEWRKRGGKELGKVVVRLSELIKDAFQRGEGDPIGALQMLGDYLAHLFEDEGGLPTDEHNRVYRALEDRRRDLAEVERLRAELAKALEEERHQRETAEAALRGWKKEKADRDQLSEQVKRVRALHFPICAYVGDPDDDELILACNHCEVPSPCDTIRALDGEEADRD